MRPAPWLPAPPSMTDVQDHRVRLNVVLKQDRTRARAANDRKQRLRCRMRSAGKRVARPPRAAQDENRRCVGRRSGRCRARRKRSHPLLLHAGPATSRKGTAGAANDRDGRILQDSLPRKRRHSRMRPGGPLRRFRHDRRRVRPFRRLRRGADSVAAGWCRRGCRRFERRLQGWTLRWRWCGR